MTGFRHGSKPVIGLIGGIGAGKSSVAGAFATRGGYIIDADKLGHDVLREPEVIANLIERWGPAIAKADGSLDRRAIGKIVFANPVERNALESLVFPYIGKRCRQEIAHGQTRPGVSFIVLDAAVMLEAGWNNAVDRIVYVDAPRDVRLARLAARSGWTDADLTAREAAQWPEPVKKSRADATILNDASPGELQSRVDQLMQEWGLLP